MAKNLEEITLYIDGECMMCNSLVQYINEKLNTGYKVNVQSIQSASTLSLPIEVKSLESVGVLANNNWHTKFSAVKLLSKMCSESINPFLRFSIWICPNIIGNVIYNLVSRNRLKISDKLFSKNCVLKSNFYPLNPKSRVEIL